MTIAIIPLTAADEGYTFCGAPPDSPNVSWELDCAAPKHVLWDVFTRLKADGGHMEVLVEGRGPSPWPIAKDGARIMAFDINDEIVSIDPARPYAWTWRAITTKAPVFRGITGCIEILDGNSPDTCKMCLAGCFDNIAPACLIGFVTKNVLIGRPLVKAAEAEFKEFGAFPPKYTGPKPPP